jgi:D-alanyl-D-alanine-carboxypeptidase/D-alanyl-D-alanine-endopeptidase
MIHFTRAILPLLLLTTCHPALAQADTHPAPTLLEQHVRALVEPLLPRFANAAVVVAIVDPDADHVLTFGQVDPEAANSPPPTPDSLFEIGSITKVFTALLLADMSLRGEVDLDDPVRQFLPASLAPPTFDNHEIVLRDLATHTSGLGDLPLDMPAMRRERGEVVPDTENIGHPSGSRYSRERLAADMPNERLSAEPGAHYAYSSFGFGLLGIGLSERAGKPLTALMRERVLAPLQLVDTQFMVEASAPTQRYAVGHDQAGRPTFFRNDDEALAGCCGLRSSARDLARLLHFQITPSKAPGAILERAIALTQAPQRRGGNTYGEHIGLAWHLLQRPRFQIYKLGQMTGQRAFVEFNAQQKRGVVVLAAHASFPVEDVARAVLPGETLDVRGETSVQDRSATPAGLARAEWSDGLLLREVSSSSARVCPGARIELRLRFEVAHKLVREYQLFVHAEGSGGRLIADQFPRPPTKQWQQGQQVTQHLSFNVPADFPSGPLQIWFGWFDVAGRSHVLRGDHDASDRVRGPNIEVASTRCSAQHSAQPEASPATTHRSE